MHTDDIDTRLAALEARAPGRDDPPGLPRTARRRRLATPVALAGALVLVIAASAAAGGAIVASLEARGAPGVENPGQPLEGAKLECMAPPAAAAYLAAHGFADVTWQVETGDIDTKTGTSHQQTTPPDHGYVVPGSILSDGKLYMVVDQRTGATGSGACPDLPMP